MKTKIPSHLSDPELVSEVKRFARDEREATGQLVAHLAELDARRLYLGAGFSSLFTYCCEVLRLSEHEAYNRIEAARAARRFPLILDLLGEGRLNLTTVRLLAPHLSKDNHGELLAAASGRSKRDVEELLARRFPRPEVPSLIRKLPVVKPTPLPTLVTPALTSVTEESALPALLPPPVHRPVVTPIAPERAGPRARRCDRAASSPSCRVPLSSGRTPGRFESGDRQQSLPRRPFRPTPLPLRPRAAERIASTSSACFRCRDRESGPHPCALP
jgi:hypothetical protein